MDKLKSVAGVVIGLAMLGGWWVTQQHVDSYNEYIVPLRPTLEQQDQLGEKLQKATEAEAKESIDAWIAEAKKLQGQVDAATPEDKEVAAIHEHMKAQAQAYTEFFELYKKGLEGDASAAALLKEKGAERQAALDNFNTAKRAYAEEHDLTIEE